MEAHPRMKPTFGRRILYALVAFAGAVIALALLYAALFGPTNRNAATVQFLVNPEDTVGTVGERLASEGLVRVPFVFALAYMKTGSGAPIRPGEYEVSASMDALTIAARLSERPPIAWVTVPVGVRKEQIEDLLTDALGWGEEERAAWEAATGSSSPNYIEGVYYPDRYFIPTDEPPAVIAGRMRDRFKEEFAPYADEALKRGIPWTRVLTIASLIQRETGTKADMPIIAGIIEERLAVGMPLAIDATLQYIEGSRENGWWPAPRAAASYGDDPFNTYRRTGLPPHPIASPGLAAIDAALHPAKTDCLFYIHDLEGVLHCSPTYKGQLANVQKYLK